MNHLKLWQKIFSCGFYLGHSVNSYFGISVSLKKTWNTIFGLSQNLINFVLIYDCSSWNQEAIICTGCEGLLAFGDL